MQFDNRERSPIFYIILFGLLIFAIVFFVNNVKKAMSSESQKDEAQKSKSSASIVVYDI